MEVETARPYFFGDIGFWAERTEVHKASCVSGSGVSAAEFDITPLQEAAARGQTQCVRLLLDAGAQFGARNVYGSTPLCEACSVGNVECVRLLLEYGAKVNPMLSSRTTSPLHEACMGGNADCVRLVIAKGASLEAYDLYYGTPLHVACASRHLECVKVLLNAGKTRCHETTLYHAAKSNKSKSNNVDMIELLVEFGANIYARGKYDRKPLNLNLNCNPLSLQQLRRIALRTTLGTRAVDLVTDLDIPNRIISYLLHQ
ncbi:ankyrin repeat and SOCS box protein 13-like [Sinocyclocheilus rhinocerous]|uniref:ankyrin repeat and SOCS box protein 13-like n=1 Tax=Sinocyclocheilus rhinocerous TaxID=307959 RepID=UPI0007B857AB|nr:PREDICTED: ankyrin repeat and SOCS box protein 13-like [Sinocyclocheilus rhinocerous]